MTKENAKELQRSIAKEALALLTLYGEVDVHPHKTCIALIGKAWSLTEEETASSMELLDREQTAIQAPSDGEAVNHVLPESELPINATGMATLNNLWGLFETAVHLSAEEDRAALYSMARWLAEEQNLEDWIEKTPQEAKAWSDGAN